MAINPNNLNDLNNLTRTLRADFQTSYQASLEESQNWAAPHLTEADTIKNAINFIFYGDIDRLREVSKDAKAHFTSLLGYNLSLTFRRFQGGAIIPREELINDDLKALPGQVNKLAAKAALLFKYIAIDILNNGATSAWQTYDGVNLYSNTHSVGDGAFDNLLAGTGDLTVDLETAYSAFESFPNDLNIVRDNNTPTHGVFPRQLRWEALRELQSAGNTEDSKNSGVINPHQGLITPIIENQLSDSNDWFLFRSTNTEKPFIAITNQAASNTNNQLVMENRPNAEGKIIDADFKWLIHVVRYLYPTHPHLHAKVVNA